MEYEIAEVRVEGDRVLLVLNSEQDSFAIDVPFQEIQSMSEDELELLLKGKIKERLQLLAAIKKKRGRREPEEA